MSSSNEQIDKSRVFLHDLASPLAVLNLVVKKLMSVQRGEITVEPAKYEELLKRAHESVEKIKNLHADQKAYLSAIEEKKT